ncbi:MAG: phosphofructokinase [Bacteroidetes bacterium 4572_128]|nr:MAG: phosphofructokinase [Bacteroidetes bacterium 4572_128]
MSKLKKTIAILTGGGDVPGLNPAIRSLTIRAIRSNFKVIGLRKGWAGITEMVRDKNVDNSLHFLELKEKIVNKWGRMGGTFLHTSRTRPSNMPKNAIPEHLKYKYTKDKNNDLTEEVIKNLCFLEIDYLIPIGGDDTLSYAVELHKKGIKIIGIPKTMDNDVFGTDYCIGFSTCVSRTIMMTNNLRTSASSHERLLILEVFGRYAGFTAMLPTMAGSANRCVIPEYKFNIENLAKLLIEDRKKSSGKYSIVMVSEGASFEGQEMLFENNKKDMFGHQKLGGIGDMVSNKLKQISHKFNNGKTINIINQKLGYLVRGGDPDAIDSIVPMAYGNIAFDLITKGIHGKMVVIKNGKYDNVDIEIVVSNSKLVNVKQDYNTKKLRPFYKSFENRQMLIM